jgi:hypothetical protein
MGFGCFPPFGAIREIALPSCRCRVRRFSRISPANRPSRTTGRRGRRRRPSRRTCNTVAEIYSNNNNNMQPVLRDGDFTLLLGYVRLTAAGRSDVILLSSPLQWRSLLLLLHAHAYYCVRVHVHVYTSRASSLSRGATRRRSSMPENHRSSGGTAVYATECPYINITSGSRTRIAIIIMIIIIIIIII